jgi:hypothetical protein
MIYHGNREHTHKDTLIITHDRGGIEVRHHTLEDVGDLGGVDCSPTKRRGRSAGDGRDGAQGKKTASTETETASIETERMGRRRLRPRQSAGEGDGFDRDRAQGTAETKRRGHRRCRSSGGRRWSRSSETAHQGAEQSSVNADLQAGAAAGAEREWAPARGAERRRCRSSRDRARAESSGGWGKWGEEGKKSQPAKRYFAKCKLCMAHFVLYAPRIFDT